MSQSYEDPTLQSFLDSLLSHLQNRDHEDCLALLRIVRMRGLKDPTSAALISAFSALPSDDDYHQAVQWVERHLKDSTASTFQSSDEDPFVDLDVVSVDDDLDAIDNLALLDVTEEALKWVDEFVLDFDFDAPVVEPSQRDSPPAATDENSSVDEFEEIDANLAHGPDEISVDDSLDFEFDDLHDISLASSFHPSEAFDGQELTKELDPLQLQALSSATSDSEAFESIDPPPSSEFADASRPESDVSDPSTPPPHNNAVASAPSVDSINWDLNDDSIANEASSPSIDESADPLDSEHFDFALGPEPSIPVDQYYSASTPSSDSGDSTVDEFDLDFDFDGPVSEPSQRDSPPEATDDQDFDFDLGLSAPAPIPAPEPEFSAPINGDESSDNDDDFDFDFGFTGSNQPAIEKSLENMPYAEPEGDFFPPPLNSSGSTSTPEFESPEDAFFSSPSQSAPGVPDYAPVDGEFFFPPPLNSQPADSKQPQPALRQAFPTDEPESPEVPSHTTSSLSREPSPSSGPRPLIDELTPTYYGTTPLPSPQENSFSPLDEDELLALGEGLSNSGSSALLEDSEFRTQRYVGEPLVPELGTKATPLKESPLVRSLQESSDERNPFAENIPTGVNSKVGTQSASSTQEAIHRPPSEAVDTPEAALTKARSLYENARFHDALELIDTLLEVDPSYQDANDLRTTVINELERTLRLQLGALSQRPTLLVDMNDIAHLDLDHRAGFLLSQIDGFLTIEDILDMSAMSNLETLTLLVDLMDKEIIKPS